jgi:hypothetical protein
MSDGPPDHPGVKIVPLTGDPVRDAAMIESFVSVPGNTVDYFTNHGDAFAVFTKGYGD